MSLGRRSVLTAVACAALAFAWQAAVVHGLHGGNWTSLFRAGDRFAEPSEASVGLYVFRDSDGYDGQFYRLTARDPFFTRGWEPYVQFARLRYGRILVPLAARALALWQDRWTDAALIASVIVSVLLGTYWTSRLFELRGRHPDWGALFLLVPATMISADRVLLDCSLCAALAAYALMTAKGKSGWAPMACASLIKETGAFLALGSGLAALRNRQWRLAALAALTQVPALAWFGFVRMHTPPSEASAALANPVAGQLQRLFTPRSYALSPTNQMIAWTFDALAVAGLLCACGFALWFYRRADSPVAVAGLLFAALGLALGQREHLSEVIGYARPVSPLCLLLFVEGIAGRRWWLAAAPLAMTASLGLSFGSDALRILRGFLGSV